MAYQAQGYNNTNVAVGVAHQEDDRRIEVLESALVHPVNDPTFSNDGDAVSFGEAGIGVRVGVDATVNTEHVPVQTRGVFNLAVTGDDGAPAAIAIGGIVFIGAAGALSSDTAGIRFGIALDAVASGATTNIAVQVGAGA